MVSINNGRIKVTFNYDPELVRRAKEIIGHKYDPKDKAWYYPVTEWSLDSVYCAFENKLSFSDQFVKMRNAHKSPPYVKSTLPLYPFQHEAVGFAYSRQGRVLICDEVGLGKTIEALAYLHIVRPKRILILTPTSILYKWKDEIQKWLNVPAGVVHTSKMDIPNLQYVVTTYNLLGMMFEKFKVWNPSCLVLDELHHAKNYKAKRTKAVRAIGKNCSQIIGLSGTPLINKPQELYNVLNLLDPLAWGYSYLNRYCYNKRTGHYDGATNLDELKLRLSDYMIARTKREVMNQLPPLTMSTYSIDADTRYIDKINNRDATVLKNFDTSPAEVTEPIQMMQLTLMGLEEIKIQKLKGIVDDLLYNLPNKKLVIYVSYLRSLRLLTEELLDYGVSIIEGKVSAKNRQAIIKDWQYNKAGNRIMAITSAGSEGIDLFGKDGIDCSTLIFVGRQWSPEYEAQIIGRVDRVGQEYPVSIIYLNTHHWADDSLHNLLNDKGEIIEKTTGKKNQLKYLENFKA